MCDFNDPDSDSHAALPAPPGDCPVQLGTTTSRATGVHGVDRVPEVSGCNARLIHHVCTFIDADGSEHICFEPRWHQWPHVCACGFEWDSVWPCDCCGKFPKCAQRKCGL